MGTHPIFESDFDCLTDWEPMEKFLHSFAKGPGIALLCAGASIAVLWGIMRYASRGVRRAPRTLGPDPNKTVKLPLIKITQVSHDTKIFRFGLPEGHRLGLPVGQHVNTKAKIDGKLVIRAYTPISSDDDIGFVDLLIKVYFPNEKFPTGGKMTQYINNLKIGDGLDFTGPKGRIIYQRNGQFKIRGEKKDDKPQMISGIRNIGLVAGGSGITPMLQIVRDVFKSEEDTRLWLLFANQTESDILLREEIEDIKRQHPNRFSFMYTLDRPNDSWTYQKGFINKEMCAAHLPVPGEDTMILMCGPPPMIKFALLPNLEALGHSENRTFAY